MGYSQITFILRKGLSLQRHQHSEEIGNGHLMPGKLYALGLNTTILVALHATDKNIFGEGLIITLLKTRPRNEDTDNIVLGQMPALSSAPLLDAFTSSAAPRHVLVNIAPHDVPFTRENEAICFP